jgi:hypothetical protein
LFAVLFAAVLMVAGPALAQDEGAARRTALAERYVQLSVGDHLADVLETQIENELLKTDDLPAAERAWMAANMPDILMRAMEGLMADIVPLYAEQFTEPELEALVAFFEGPLGPSIAVKQMEVGIDMQELLAPVLVAFVTELTNKYCAEFACGPQGFPSSSKSRTR